MTEHAVTEPNQQKPDEVVIQNHIQYIDKELNEVNDELYLERVRYIKADKRDKVKLSEMREIQDKLRTRINELNNDKLFLKNERRSLLQRCARNRILSCREKAKQNSREMKHKFLFKYYKSLNKTPYPAIMHHGETKEYELIVM